MKNTWRMFRDASHRTGVPLKYEVVVRDALAMRTMHVRAASD